MNESVHDALERIINICRQQLALLESGKPSVESDVLHEVTMRASMGQRAIRAQNTHNE